MGVRDELAAAAAIAGDISSRHLTHSFLADLRKFLEHLTAIPDCGPTGATDDVMAAIRREADRMIEKVETRIEDGGDRAAAQQEMASAIYKIRRSLEQIDAWHRHFLG